MTPERERRLEGYLSAHHRVVTRCSALQLGMTSGEIDGRVRSGRWRRVHRGVYTPAGTALAPLGLLYAALQAAGPRSAASHLSAGWLWGLLEETPCRPEIVTAWSSHPELTGVRVRRQRRPLRAVTHRSFRVTHPVETAIDLASVLPEPALDRMVDVGVQRRLFHVEGLHQALRRDAGSKRPGDGVLTRALDRRGMIEPPAASVLESATLRRLHEWGIVPLSVELEVDGGRYRLDFVLAPMVALEVDGYAYHASPEAMRRDLRRHNELQMMGWLVIRTDWVTVLRHPEELRAQVLAALEMVAGRTRR